MLTRNDPETKEAAAMLAFAPAPYLPAKKPNHSVKTA